MSMTFDDIGSGYPLLLIHGFPHDRTLWQAQLHGLGDGIRVIAPDLRGFGGSTDVPGTMTMDAYAADLEHLLEELGVTEAVICGLSMGGYVALALLAAYPNVVRGLILCNTRAGADDEKGRAGRHAMAMKARDEGVVSIAETLTPKMMANTTAVAHPDRCVMVQEMMVRQRAGAVIAALRGMATRADRTPMLAQITVPTLIITGSADDMIPPSESEAMAAAITGSKLVVIPGAGHLSNVEAPDAFNAAVREFIAERSWSSKAIDDPVLRAP